MELVVMETASEGNRRPLVRKKKNQAKHKNIGIRTRYGVSASWYRYRPKPNLAQALQNAASSAAATGSSNCVSLSNAVPAASL